MVGPPEDWTLHPDAQHRTVLHIHRYRLAGDDCFDTIAEVPFALIERFVKNPGPALDEGHHAMCALQRLDGRAIEVGPALEDQSPAQFSRLVVDQANAQQLLDDADGVGALFRRPIGKHILEHLQPPWTDCSRIVIGLDPPGAIIIRPHRSAFTGPWVHQAALCRNETVSVPGNIRLPTEMLLPLDPCARLVDQLTGARLAEVLGSLLDLDVEPGSQTIRLHRPQAIRIPIRRLADEHQVFAARLDDIDHGASEYDVIGGLAGYCAGQRLGLTRRRRSR